MKYVLVNDEFILTVNVSEALTSDRRFVKAKLFNVRRGGTYKTAGHLLKGTKKYSILVDILALEASLSLTPLNDEQINWFKDNLPTRLSKHELVVIYAGLDSTAKFSYKDADDFIDDVEWKEFLSGEDQPFYIDDEIHSASIEYLNRK